MESRQAVHEHRAGIGGVHQLFRDAIWGQRSDPFLPDLHRFAHGHPNVGVQHVGPLHRFHGVCLKAQLCVGFRGDGLTGVDQRLIREINLRRTGGEVHA